MMLAGAPVTPSVRIAPKCATRMPATRLVAFCAAHATDAPSSVSANAPASTMRCASVIKAPRLATWAHGPQQRAE
jgi:hypothetical protein